MTKSNEKDYNDFFHKGLDYFHRGELENSLKFYNKAIKLNPLRSNIWANRAQVLYKMKNYDEAFKSAKKNYSSFGYSFFDFFFSFKYFLY